MPIAGGSEAAAVDVEKTLQPAATSAVSPMAAPRKTRQHHRARRAPSSRQARTTAAPFAGRVGGNQECVADSDSDVLRKRPDAAPLSSFSSSVDLRGFTDPDLWRMAIIEGWATFLLISLLGATASGLTTTSQSPFAQTLYAALVGFLTLGLFTYCLGPITGSHLNPSITLATLFAGLSTVPRAALYIAAQSLGGVVAGYWLRLGLGNSYFPKGLVPGCSVVPDLVSPGQLFVLEFTWCQALIFLAFGLGLDPRQGKTLTPAFAPSLIGLTLAIGNLTSGFVKEGYTGMSFNPARCLGLMAAKGDMQYHYIHWLGPLAAATLNGIMYHWAPPWARESSTFSLRRHRP